MSLGTPLFRHHIKVLPVRAALRLPKICTKLCGILCRRPCVACASFDPPELCPVGRARMLASDVAHRWRPRTPAARVLSEAPADVYSPAERVTPLRKPPNFQPAVQRWSFQMPSGQSQFRMAVFGAEAPNAAALNDHPLFQWIDQSLSRHPDGPHCYQHARSRTLQGTSTHIVSAYWVNEDRFVRWTGDKD